MITSYLAANAIILPITGWLIAHLGRRNYFLLSIGVFTLGSGMCGMATSLGQLILFRVLQGLAGGGLQPSSQAVLLDAFPAEQQGAAMTLFGIAALIAPVVGPTLGGWITDNYSWRLGVLHQCSGRALWRLAPARSAAATPTTSGRSGRRCGDGRSASTASACRYWSSSMVCWEVALSKGQEWDWLDDPFWRVQTLAILFVVGLAG